MKKIIFEGKVKVSTSWVGTLIQKNTFKDKFGKIKKGESRSCTLDTKWGNLQLPDYKDVNKFGNKYVKVTVEIIKKNPNSQK